MRITVGWFVVFLGGLIGTVPTAVYQVWNGASLLGLILSVVGASIVFKEVTNV
jgi:uncharacterized membrane protein YeaQ/YmgE (transglycosylase-associated protein family)